MAGAVRLAIGEGAEDPYFPSADCCPYDASSLRIAIFRRQNAVTIGIHPHQRTGTDHVG